MRLYTVQCTVKFIFLADFVFLLYVAQSKQSTRLFLQSSELAPQPQEMVSPWGRPFANAANSYVEFPACKFQKFGHWANIRPLLEKAKKLTICIGNSAPLRTFFLKNLEKFDYKFLRKQKLFIGPF